MTLEVSDLVITVGSFFGLFCPNCIDFINYVNLENLTVEKQPGIEGLILG